MFVVQPAQKGKSAADGIQLVLIVVAGLALISAVLLPAFGRPREPVGEAQPGAATR
jgi:hypothetical protein